MGEKSPTKRIDYIDLAKGVCILLVVLSHIMTYYKVSFPYDSALKCFRMPLYFFLSGVFFKQYEGFWGFLKRKINKLVIPFAFFYLMLGILLPMCLYEWCGVKMLSYHANYGLVDHLLQVVNDEKFPNAAIWFLVCLFEVNVLFYVIHLVSRNSKVLLMSVSVAVGAVGMVMSAKGINLPMFIDTTLTAMPFFALGYLLSRGSDVLSYGWRYERYEWPIVLVCAAVVFVLAYPMDYRANVFANCYFSAHISGIAGTLGVIFIAKKLRRQRILSYWGRYSIMILCTHQVVYQLIHIVIKQFALSGWGALAINLSMTMTLYVLLIPLMRRWLPYVTAQKDVIRIGQ